MIFKSFLYSRRGTIGFVKNISITAAFVGLFFGALPGCTDQGTAPLSLPVILSVTPDSAAVGDTIRIAGKNFGSNKGTSVLTIGGRTIPDAGIISWSDIEIKSVIPPGVVNTAIVIMVNGASSNTKSYPIKGFVAGSLSFALEVHPILLANCAISGCHVPPSPTGGFDQTTFASIRAGGATFGVHAVTPGDSSSSSSDVHVGSGIMKMLRDVNNPYGSGFRMPLSGRYATTGLPDSLIVKIGTWIAQGAQNN